MRELLIFLLFSACLILSSCRNDDDKHCDVFEWSYEGNDGPDEWGSCYEECHGTTQSPVNISSSTVDASLTALELHYEEVPVDIIYNGHTVEFEFEPGSTLILNGMVFNLLQFHFHTESEHTLSGDHFPMEVHLVHKHDATGQLAVVGIFFEEGNENTFLGHFSDSLPDIKGEHYSSEDLVNVPDLFPVDDDYYTYSGSLTTPPCSEIVTWFVMKAPVEASEAQIQKFQNILHENNRPIQALNGRIIREYQ